MTVKEVLKGIRQLGLDSAPLIYFVEGSVEYHSRCEPFFEAITLNLIQAYTSTLSLPETLILPLRTHNTILTTAFRELLLNTQGITIQEPNVSISEEASRLRALYNLRTVDAVQVATALHFGCDTLLTNDVQLKRVKELQIVVVSELDRP